MKTSSMSNNLIWLVYSLCSFLDCRDVFTKWIDRKLGKIDKSLSLTCHHRTQGNHLFSLKDYKAAVQSYTRSIETCPLENSEQLGIAYANRSAALFFLNLYEDCVEDIDLALKNNYPAHLQHKAFVRKAKCFKQLGDTTAVQSTILQIEESFQNMALVDISKKWFHYLVHLF